MRKGMSKFFLRLSLLLAIFLFSVACGSFTPNENNPMANTPPNDVSSVATSSSTPSVTPPPPQSSAPSEVISNVRLSSSEELWSLAQELWDFYKRRFIFPLSQGNNMLAGARHKGESWIPFDFTSTTFGSRGAYVSEAVGYGLLLSLFMNEQNIFDSILHDAERYLFMHSTGHYSWLGYWDPATQAIERRQTNAASDADMDIAAALILAIGRWGDNTITAELYEPHVETPYISTFTYSERVRTLLETTNRNFLNTYGDLMYINPGFVFLSQNSGFLRDYRAINASYFSFAWLRLYEQFQQREGFFIEDWAEVARDCQQIMTRFRHFDIGLQPDWMGIDGSQILTSDGAVDTRYRYDFFKDAVRVPWRLAKDAIWFNDSFSQDFCNRAVDFVWNNRAGTYFDGNAQHITDNAGNPIFSSGGAAMWSTLFLASDAPEEQKNWWADELRNMVITNEHGSFVSGDNRYFENSLALFALIMLSGRFVNFYELSAN